MTKRWPELEKVWDEEYALKFWKAGHSYHHSTENGGQIGALQQLIFNRDPNQHTHTNFLANGLPLEVLKELGKDLFGTADAVESFGDYKPMNKGKAVFAALALKTLEMHNSLTLCNWTMPLWASPHADRKYAGDADMEAKVYSAVTGDEMTTEDLRKIGHRCLTLFRALNTRAMGEIDQRNEHDTIPTWAFEHGEEEPFTKGSNKMDREDMELAKDLFYEELGWDVKTGVPTRETLEELGLKDVADELEEAKLLPA